MKTIINYLRFESIALIQTYLQMLFILMCITFAFLTRNHYGNIIYALPFILAYGFSKGALFLVSEMGDLKNPFKLMIIINIILVIGTLFLFNNNLDSYLIAASLVGISTSLAAPILKTNLSLLKEKPEHINPLVNMILRLVNIFAIIIVFSLLMASKFHIGCIVFLSFAIISLLYNCYLYKKANNHDPIFANIKLFKGVKAAVLIFITAALMITLREYNNNIVIIGAIIILFVLIYLLFKYLKQLSLYKRLTILTGSITTFVIIFDFIKYVLLDDMLMFLILLVLLILLMFVSFIIDKKLSIKQWIIVVILGLLISLIEPLNLLGVCIVLVSNNCITNLLTTCYSKEHDEFNLQIVKTKFTNIGALLQQLILLIVVLLASIIIYHSKIILESFVFRIANTVLLTPVDVVYIIFVIIIIISLIYFYLQSDKNKKS